VHRCKKRFLRFFILVTFLRFLNFFIFQTFFFILKKRWQSSDRQADYPGNKKHFQNNSNEIDLCFMCRRELQALAGI